MHTAGVHHLAVRVRDLARAQAFYCEVLGLTVREHLTADDGDDRAVWLDLGERRFLALELVDDGDPKPDAAPGWHCVALSIQMADRERWRRRLEAAGHPVERESAFTLYVRDPDGALVALSHHPEPAPRPP